MTDAEATGSEIPQRPGHGSLAILRGAENEHVGAVAGLLGLET